MIDIEMGGWDMDTRIATPDPRLDKGKKVSWIVNCCADDHSSIKNVVSESSTTAKFIIPYV